MSSMTDYVFKQEAVDYYLTYFKQELEDGLSVPGTFLELINEEDIVNVAREMAILENGIKALAPEDQIKTLKGQVLLMLLVAVSNASVVFGESNGDVTMVITPPPSEEV
jgi:hypothetical protein